MVSKGVNKRDYDVRAFDLERFDASAVVNPRDNFQVASNVSTIVEYAIVEHLNKIVDGVSGVFSVSQDFNAIEEPDIVKVDLVDPARDLDGEFVNSPANLQFDPSAIKAGQDNLLVMDQKKQLSQSEIDEIKNASYQEGYKDGVEGLRDLITQLRASKDFTDVLYAKLSQMSLGSNIDEAMVAASVESILNVVNKLYLEIPVNFKKIVTEGLIAKLKKCYKRGEIKLVINPKRRDLCIDILKFENIPDDMRDHFNIVEDNSMEQDECRLEYMDASFEYNKEQLMSETEKIITQLQHSLQNSL